MKHELLANLGQAVPVIADDPELAPDGDKPVVALAEGLGLGGGILLALVGAFTKQDVLIGVGSSLSAAGLFSAIVRHTR